MSYTWKRRDDTRILRSALDEVKAIQALLADVYKDAGDGRTVLRELVQNADDARASQSSFVVLETGWSDAQNGLMRGSSLLVANDGPFTAEDRDAIHMALGGSKGEQADKIGRFGIGLKSVFHICEAIVYLGTENRTVRSGVLNPWAGTGSEGNADPLHPDWDKLEKADIQRLLKSAERLLGSFDNGLLLWIPLRCADHLDRAADRPYGLGQFCPGPDVIRTWFERSGSLALLLAQCGHLHSIKAYAAPTADSIPSRTKLVEVFRQNPDCATWVGRYRDDVSESNRSFNGIIKNGEQRTFVLGIEAIGHNGLRQQRTAQDWPHDLKWNNGKCNSIPRKALAHAVITILRPDKVSAKPGGARIRWAVFLPLDDDPQPRQSSVIENVGNVAGGTAWEIILHGYFWPSQDRRSIPGVTDHESGTGDNEVRLRWNRAIRDEMLLPLLPGVLATAVAGVSHDVATEMLRAVAGSHIVECNIDSVTRRNLLLPLVTQDGVRWGIVGRTTAKILSFPAWGRVPESLRTKFSQCQNEDTDDFVFIADDAPKLGGRTETWPVNLLDQLLQKVTSEDLKSFEELEWIRNFVQHALTNQASDNDEGSIVVARWLTDKIAEGHCR